MPYFILKVFAFVFRSSKKKISRKFTGNDLWWHRNMREIRKTVKNDHEKNSNHQESSIYLTGLVWADFLRPRNSFQISI